MVVIQGPTKQNNLKIPTPFFFILNIIRFKSGRGQQVQVLGYLLSFQSNDTWIVEWGLFICEIQLSRLPRLLVPKSWPRHIHIFQIFLFFLSIYTAHKKKSNLFLCWSKVLGRGIREIFLARFDCFIKFFSIFLGIFLFTSGRILLDKNKSKKHESTK